MIYEAYSLHMQAVGTIPTWSAMKMLQEHVMTGGTFVGRLISTGSKAIQEVGIRCRAPSTTHIPGGLQILANFGRDYVQSFFVTPIVQRPDIILQAFHDNAQVS